MSPLISTFGGTTLHAYGFGQGGAAYRAFILSGFTSQLKVSGINVDTAGNVYAMGATGATTSTIAKYSSISGAITWQVQDTVQGYLGYIAGPAVDSASGNLTFGNATGSAVGSNFLLSSTGSITWQNKWNGGSNGQTITCFPAGLDTSGNQYGWVTNAYPLKFTNTGSISWQRSLTRASTTLQNGIYQVAVDSSGNGYFISGYYDSASVLRGTLLVKYNTSGTIQWQSAIHTGSSGGYVPTGYDATSAGVTGMSLRPWTGTGWVVTSVNASGTAVFYRQLTTTNQPTSSGAAIGTDGSIYSIGYYSSGSTGALYVVKYNSSGTLQWQRKITSTSSTFDPSTSGIRCVDANNYFVSYNDNSSYVTLKLPTDGTLTGSYPVGALSISYATTTDLTDAAWSTAVWGSVGFTDSAGAQAITTSTETLGTSTALSLTKA